MKKFITAIPLQIQGQLDAYLYEAVGNARLQMEKPVSFPILTAVNGYVQPGEEFRVIALTPDSEDGRRNLEALDQQLAALCESRALPLTQAEAVMLEHDEKVASHVAAFQKLIDMVQDDDELFACVTYGTKPLSQVIMMAVQYAYRVKNNASISCILYGQIDRSRSRNKADWRGYVYDETALVQLDEIVRKLAECRVPNPKEVLDRILAM